MNKFNYSGSSKSEEQKHYENLTSYFKSIVQITSTTIGIITAVALFFTWSSLRDLKSDMKDDLISAKSEYTEAIAGLRSEISELKKEASTTLSRTQNESRDAIQRTMSYSKDEIHKITASTKQIAIDETQKQLNYIFGTDKIQNLIQNQAVNEVKRKVVDIIDERTKNMGDISDAAAELRAYKFSGRNRLRSYFINPKNTSDSIVARLLYEQIAKDFDKIIPENTEYDNKNLLAQIDSSSIVLLKKGILKKGSFLESQISVIMNLVNGPEYDLYQCLVGITRLRLLTGISFHILDIEGVNKWYNSINK